MFVCENCGDVFEECETVEEQHPYGEGYATERWAVCPCCGSSNIDEAKKCEHCGEWVAELKDDLCEECYGDMYGE